MSTATEPQIDADQLEVSRIRALRGPNYWRLAPVIACDVQLGSLEQVSSADIPGFYERLTEAIPTLAEQEQQLLLRERPLQSGGRIVRGEVHGDGHPGQTGGQPMR